MNMKTLIKTLALAGLMGSGLALAVVPADFNASPGVLLVNWHEGTAMSNDGNAKLEVRDESGELLSSVQPSMMGTQYVRIPSRTQGNLTISLGNESSSYQIPYGIGEGRQR